MGTKLVTNCNITVTGKSGSSIKFKKGKATHVPDHAVEDCMHAGAIPAEGETIKERPTKPADADAPTGVERKQRIIDAIETVVMLNERGTFNANGAPKQPVLEKAVGFVLDTREIDTLWHEFDKAQKAATQVDVGEVVTINDASPVVSEDEDKFDEKETEAKEGLGGAATEAAEASDEPAKTAPKVSKKKTAKKST